MQCFLKSFLCLSAWSIAAWAQPAVKPVIIEPGVSSALAAYRHAEISNIQYTLDFNVPPEKNVGISATESVSFNLRSNSQPLQLDFKEQADHIKSIRVNGKITGINLREEHLIVSQKLLHSGPNKISLQFTAGNASLNRNDDYLYALFVPDRARTVFPCFDQPDLKARFLLTLRVPLGWKVMANAVKKDSSSNVQQMIYRFADSDKLSTYLFSFAAGKFNEGRQMIDNRSAGFLYRETDSAKIRFSVDSIFIAHKNAIDFLEHWTGIPFPFQKVGFVAIPDFQFGGMEHPGEVQYKASSLFLDRGATKDMHIARSNLISHETAHMWFGDMVTMQWFNDVWMKEVFANFMADKVTEELMGVETFNLKFLQDHYPAAYGVDRTAGANPIRQQLSNLQDAGSLYGNIIYHKAPIMMRQLELLMGKENFRRGVQEYLKKYQYGNASWNDLIAILAKYTKANLYEWNKVWVNQAGRPVFDYNIIYQGDKINSFVITQRPESGAARIWPQAFSITLVYPDLTKTICVNMQGGSSVLKEAAGLSKPAFILFNSDGMGYGLFPTDTDVTDHLFSLESPLQRTSIYINAYENMLAGRDFKPAELLRLFSDGLTAEKNEMNLRLLTGYINNIFWEFLSASYRNALAPELENAIWNAMQQQPMSDNKKILFKTYQEVCLTSAGLAALYNIWNQQVPPRGIMLSEDDYTSLAFSLTLKIDTARNILKEQESRVTNLDRKKRIEFLMPALSADSLVRDRFFNSLKERKNRQKEAWVISALAFLHHPLRQGTSIKYLPESLNLVEEIQKTGDVFFPQSWLGAIFSNYQDPKAAAIVQDFLKAHPVYNPKLKNKILQATDNLFRAQKLININSAQLIRN